MEQIPVAPKRIDVGAAIMETLSRVEVMGANDSERSRLMHLLEKYQQGKISADEALAAAEGTEQSKLDYH